MKFLKKLGGHWNLYRFHYRNKGTANYRVLVGMKIPPEDRKKVDLYLEELV